MRQKYTYHLLSIDPMTYLDIHLRESMNVGDRNKVTLLKEPNVNIMRYGYTSKGYYS